MLNGQQIRRSTQTTKRRVAERIYFSIRTRIAEGKYLEVLPGQEKTVLDLMKKYISEHSKPNKAEKSYVRDRSSAQHLIPYFGDTVLAALTTQQISSYKVLRQNEGAKPATINKELGTFRHALNLALREWGWIRDNPATRVAKVPDHSKKERWLTIEEEKKLLHVTPKWLQDMIEVAVNTGLRLNEQLSLTWKQVDLSRETISIDEQKNGEKATLPLNQTVLAILKRKTKIRNITSNLVFPSQNGTKMNDANLRRSFYLAIKKSGIEPLRWHDLRHTFATRLVQLGVDLYSIQRLGRWKSIQMINRYGHHNTESLRKGVTQLDKEQASFITILAQSPTDRANKANT